MSAALIDGKALAATLRARVGEQARSFEAEAGRKAGLAVVLVGEDPASQVYVRSKGKATLEAGCEAAVVLDGRVPHAMLLEIFTSQGAGTLIRA